MNVNRGIASLISSHQPNPFHIRASFFHSTPFLEKRRRTHWDSGGSAYNNESPRRFNYQNKRFQRFNAKQTLLRNVSAFAEDFFQGLHNDFDEYDSSSRWSQRDFRSNRQKPSRSRKKGQYQRRWFSFTDDFDSRVERFFHTEFGGFYYYDWSFVNEGRQRDSSHYSNTYRRSNWRFTDEEDYDDDTADSDTHISHLRSERLALGLNASGPLNLEDVKNAYRACALKWHPDRHQGPSKAVAEEKFKACSAAYQLLCDKMALN